MIVDFLSHGESRPEPELHECYLANGNRFLPSKHVATSLNRGQYARLFSRSTKVPMTIILNVSGMTCQNCLRHVRNAILKTPGVQSAEVSLESGRAVVTGGNLEPDRLVQAVQRAGYSAEPASE